MKILLDTCIISELVAKKPNEQVVEWIESLDENLLFLSVLTIGELTAGIECLPSSKKKQKLSDWLETDLLVRFDGRIIPIDYNVTVQWGALTANQKEKGRPKPVVDGLLAASALIHNMQIATRNEKDFQFINLQIINPWKLPK